MQLVGLLQWDRRIEHEPENPWKQGIFVRDAIEVAWSQGRLDTVNKMYGYKLFDPMDKPTNVEFISCVSEKIKGSKSIAG